MGRTMSFSWQKWQRSNIAFKHLDKLRSTQDFTQDSIKQLPRKEAVANPGAQPRPDFLLIYRGACNFPQSPAGILPLVKKSQIVELGESKTIRWFLKLSSYCSFLIAGSPSSSPLRALARSWSGNSSHLRPSQDSPDRIPPNSKWLNLKKYLKNLLHAE